MTYHVLRSGWMRNDYPFDSRYLTKKKDFTVTFTGPVVFWE